MDFQNEPLKNMVAVGALASRTARLWIRSEQSGLLRIRWWPKTAPDGVSEAQLEIPSGNADDNTAGIEIPGPNGPPLQPLTAYEYECIRGRDGLRLGKGSFETAPERPEDTPDDFSIALMSCHQPFDPKGRLLGKSVDMLRATLRCLRQNNTKIVLTIGDQMYSDYPKKLSLFDSEYFRQIAPPGRKEILECTAAEVREIFHRRYRHFFAVPEWQQLHAEYPVYPILDDHDIVDNWGSAEFFREPRWQSLGRGARAAYFDYQGKRVLPETGELREDFDASFVYGATATYLLDLRSSRTGGDDGQLYSPAQENRFRDFLAAHGDKKALFVVLSVPIIHLPRTLARIMARLPPAGEDFSDRWSSGAHIRDRDRFLRMVAKHRREHPHQLVVFLSGDIHIACVHEIGWHGGSLGFQVVSSGFTHVSGWLIRAASSLLIRMNHHFGTAAGDICGTVKLLKGIPGTKQNPYAYLNLGLIRVENSATGPVRLRFQIYGHRGEEPRCVYESPPIESPRPI